MTDSWTVAEATDDVAALRAEVAQLRSVIAALEENDSYDKGYEDGSQEALRGLREHIAEAVEDAVYTWATERGITLDG